MGHVALDAPAVQPHAGIHHSRRAEGAHGVQRELGVRLHQHPGAVCELDRCAAVLTGAYTVAGQQLSADLQRFGRRRLAPQPLHRAPKLGEQCRLGLAFEPGDGHADAGAGNDMVAIGDTVIFLQAPPVARAYQKLVAQAPERIAGARGINPILTAGSVRAQQNRDAGQHPQPLKEFSIGPNARNWY